jgi:hypothetical protein
MARISKARREADLFREKIKSLLAEPQGWRHYEDQRYWLQKLLRRDEDYIFTGAEREAVDRIIFARVLIEGWAGFTVPELARVAQRYVADFDYEDELFLKETERATKLTRDEMRHLVSLCIMSGMDIPRFPPRQRLQDA